MSKEPTLGELIAEWEAENRKALAPALEFLQARFINRGHPWPWDRSDDYREAALKAYRAIYWLLQPLEYREVKYTKLPFDELAGTKYEREEAGGDG